MYKLIQEDLNETTFSSLQKTLEKKVNKPISTTLSFLEACFEGYPEDLLTFYADSDLGKLKETMDGSKLVEKTLGMKLSDYLRRIEELSLFFDTNVYSLRAMEFLAEEEPKDFAESQIIGAAREIAHTSSLTSGEMEWQMIRGLAEGHAEALVESTASGLIQEALTGKKSLDLMVWQFALSQIPEVKLMSSVEEAYTMAELQQFFPCSNTRAENISWLS